MSPAPPICGNKNPTLHFNCYSGTDSGKDSFLCEQILSFSYSPYQTIYTLVDSSRSCRRKAIIARILYSIPEPEHISCLT